MKLLWVTLCLAVLPQWALAQGDGNAGEEVSDISEMKLIRWAENPPNNCGW